MHSHRTGAACCCATSAGHLPCPADGEQHRCCGEPRVIGLGAPLTVLIRPCARQTPILRDQVRAALAEHERRQPQPGTSAAEWWAEEASVWEAMLAALEEEDAAQLELTWPTAYAHGVLFRALREAVARLAPPSSPADVGRVGEALETACACLATWRAFIAVDNGGLQDVVL